MGAKSAVQTRSAASASSFLLFIIHIVKNMVNGNNYVVIELGVFVIYTKTDFIPSK